MNENNNDTRFSGFDEVVQNAPQNTPDLKEQEPISPTPQEEVLKTESTHTCGSDETINKSQIFPSGNYGEQKISDSFVPYYNPHKKEPKEIEKTPKTKQKFSLGALIAVALITAILVSGCFVGFLKFGNIITPSENGQVINTTNKKIVEINGSIETMKIVKNTMIYVIEEDLRNSGKKIIRVGKETDIFDNLSEPSKILVRTRYGDLSEIVVLKGGE